MSDPQPSDGEPTPKTQPTQPREGEPIEIPVPKVSTIRAAIRKVAKPERDKPEHGDE